MAKLLTLAPGGNYLLNLLSQSDRELLRPDLEALSLDVDDVLEQPNKPIKHVYFIEAGIASVVTTVGGDRDIEVGIIGREGMSGCAVILGDGRSPHVTFMQVGGQAQRLAVAKFHAAMNSSATFRALAMRSALLFSIQTAHTAVANARASVEQRLARWLLMAHDRLDGDELPLTHEFLSMMLAVRRAGVTVALHAFERQNLIRTQRRHITIIDREGIEEFAEDFYGVPEAEFQRLMTPRSQEPGLRVV